MMIIEVDRSYHGEQRKLLSDSTKRVIGIRQELYAARPILYVHTALSWEGEEESLPGNLDITANLSAAIAALGSAAATIRRAMPVSADRTLQLAEISLAIDKLNAIAAPEMVMKAGQWFAVTEKNDEKRRKTASPRPSPTSGEGAKDKA